MAELLFVSALVMLGVGASLGQRVEAGILVDRPRNMGLLRFSTGIAGLLGIAQFIWGFFAFAWWLPLLGLIGFMLIGGRLTHLSLRSTATPGLAILFSLVGIALAMISFLSSTP
jgi:hypothetical protein